MSYRTNLRPGLTVTSRDVRLTRGKSVRIHTIVGLGYPVAIEEDRTTLRTIVRSGSTVLATRGSLSAAYAVIAAL